MNNKVDQQKRDFLVNEFPKLLTNLATNKVPKFGVMTPQHMMEHLAMLIKSSVKRYGEPEGEPTKGQLGFKRFIAKGAIMKHRPKGKTKADLPKLKYDTIVEAATQAGVATKRFYDHYDSQPDFVSYSPMAGELDFEELQTMHYMHVRFHLWQFGLLDSYPE